MYSGSGLSCLFADEFKLLQLDKSVLKVGVSLADRAQDPIEETPPDDRGNLQQLLNIIFQPVDARHDHTLEGVRNCDLLHRLRRAPTDSSIGAHQDAHVDEGSNHLLEKERIAFDLAQNRLVWRAPKTRPRLRGCRPTALSSAVSGASLTSVYRSFSPCAPMTFRTRTPGFDGSGRLTTQKSTGGAFNQGQEVLEQGSGRTRPPSANPRIRRASGCLPAARSKYARALTKDLASGGQEDRGISPALRKSASHGERQ